MSIHKKLTKTEECFIICTVRKFKFLVLDSSHPYGLKIYRIYDIKAHAVRHYDKFKVFFN